MHRVREELRIREQDFGNFQDPEQMKECKAARSSFGRFFYRFPSGESGLAIPASHASPTRARALFFLN